MEIKEVVTSVYTLELTREEVENLADMSASYDEGEKGDKIFDFSVTLDDLLATILD